MVAPDISHPNRNPSPTLISIVRAIILINLRLHQWYNEYFKGIRSIEPQTTCRPPVILSINGLTVGIIMINSALFSLPDGNDEHQLWIGRRCLGTVIDNLKTGDIDLRIVLMHHPLGWLNERNRTTLKPP